MKYFDANVVVAVVILLISSVCHVSCNDAGKGSHVVAHETKAMRKHDSAHGKSIQHVEISSSGKKDHFSPRPGSDISNENQAEILRCHDQANCIIPELQLEIKLKVYMCKHTAKHGVRFYYLVREGLSLHPNVEILTSFADIDEADYILFLPGSSPWLKTECTSPHLSSRLIVLDEFDFHGPLFIPTVDKYKARLTNQSNLVQPYTPPIDPLHPTATKPSWYFMYFKRSYVSKRNGVLGYYPHVFKHRVFPLTYSIAELYIPHEFNTHVMQRGIDVMCTLRGNKRMTTRQRVQDWVGEYVQVNNIENAVTAQVTTATRKTVSTSYFEQMRNSHIVVTVNPPNWEGDFRLWEALSTGALVFVDTLHVPTPYPLKDKEHLIFFDNMNKTDLFTKLDYYRNHIEDVVRIGINGYLHSMKYHRTVNVMDYLLRSAHWQTTKEKILRSEDTTAALVLPSYRHTAQQLLEELILSYKNTKYLKTAKK